ncbi:MULTISPECIES: hypothetical protein [Paraburkholderia]|uniref:DNA-binding protein n=1 Tax=Paraburkholderia caledonica TaxID=134536 RepID=A0AB73IEZ2_9BURK|nr:hypothetical protein [Paraburkholderia atlantica]MBB5507143.1 hypothetical protein [Paraburkholderia atlantica]MDP9648621.1 hypothetical protein [Paraburkholderia caledonica]
MGEVIQMADVQGGAERTVSPVSISTPLLTREAFANAVGLPAGVIIAQCDKGYWPTMKVGKRVFVNVELIRKRALEQEFKV